MQKNSQLSYCGAYAEPALLAADGKLYFTALCGISKFDNNTANVHIKADSKIFLMSCDSPCDATQMSNWKFLSVMLNNDITKGKLVMKNSLPKIMNTYMGTKGTFNGMCSFDKTATGSGMIFGELNTSATDLFRLYITHENP